MARVATLEAVCERAAPGSRERAEALAEQRSAVSQWMRDMEALGLAVEGLWRVDFEMSEGAYCWGWPEERLAFFHTPEAGFEGRVPIQ